MTHTYLLVLFIFIVAFTVIYHMRCQLLPSDKHFANCGHLNVAENDLLRELCSQNKCSEGKISKNSLWCVVLFAICFV